MERTQKQEMLQWIFVKIPIMFECFVGLILEQLLFWNFDKVLHVCFAQP